MKKLKLENKHIWLLILSFVLTCFSTVIRMWNGSLKELVLYFVLFFVIYTVVIFGLDKFSKQIFEKMHINSIEKRIYDKWSDKKFYFVIWGLLILGWLPAYLALFPGTFGYDAPWQMFQVIGQTPLSSHHPLVHTLLLGFIMNTGNKIFGTYNAGVAIFCAMQGIVVAESIAYSFIVLKKKKLAFPIVVISLAWCMFNPAIQVVTFNITKDVLFGAAFVHFVVDCYNHIFHIVPDSKWTTAKLIISGLFVCLLRNQGIYVILAFAIIYFIFVRKDKKYVLSMLSVVAMAWLFFTISHSCFGVEKGNLREMLSVPMQQLAGVCKDYYEGQPVNLSQEEFEQFTQLVPAEALSTMSITSADPIKSVFNTEEFKSDIPGYVGLYFKVGIHNIKDYIMTYGPMILGYWDMSLKGTRTISLNNTFPELSQQLGITQQSLLPGYYDFLYDYVWNTMGKRIPLFSWIMQPGVCLWIIPAMLILAIVRKDKKLALVTLLPVLFFGTLMLGPVSLMRYLYPLTILTPWMIALLFKHG